MDEELWQAYEEIIRNLYLVERLTLQQVKMKMEETYGFKASAGQYQRQFRKWKFRKNFSPEEWQHISRCADKRKRDGKETDLKIDGIRLPEKKLLKANSRYGQGSTLERLNHEIRERQHDLTSPRGIRLSPPPARSLPLDLRPLPWLSFSTSASLWFNSKANLPRRCSEALARLPSAPMQRPIGLYVTKPDFDAMTTSQRAWDASNSVNFALAAFSASNHISSPFEMAEWRRPAIVEILRTFPVQTLVHGLKITHIEREPTFDALFQLLFKDAILSQDLVLLELIMKDFEVDMANLLPGPWPWDERRPLKPRLPGRNDVDARPPLQIAIETGNAKLVQLLLDYGADVHIFGAGGCDMLSVAMWKGSEDTVQLLLKDLEGDLMPPMLACLKNKFVDSASFLWRRVKGSISGLKGLETEAITAAAEAGHIPMVKDLLEGRVEVNVWNRNGLSPLQAASRSDEDCLEVAKLLIQSRAEVDFRFDNRMPTALQIAVTRDKFELAAFLIDEGADPNAKPTTTTSKYGLASHRWGGSTLKMAIQEGSSIHIIQLLLEAGAELDDSTLIGVELHDDCDRVFQLLVDHNVPLSVEVFLSAIRGGNMNTVRLCLGAGREVNEISQGMTALTCALKTAHSVEYSSDDESGTKLELSLDICRLLIDKCPDVNVGRSRSGESALAQALQVGSGPSWDLAELILSKGAHCDNEWVLADAASTMDPILLDRILNMAASRPGFTEAFTASCIGHRALLCTASEASISTLDVLIRHGINLKSPCAAMAVQTAFNRYEDARADDYVELLLTRGVSANISSVCCTQRFRHPEQPLQILARRGRAQAMHMLLKYDANPNLYGCEQYDRTGSWRYNSILCSAIEGNSLTSVNILLEAGACVNQKARGKFGRTPLQSAAEYGRSEIVEYLIEKRANVNADPAEDAGVTALQAAAIKGYLAIAAKLIEHGADVNAPAAKIDGRTALEGACEYGRIDMVELLIRAGANLNTAQYDNATAFAKKNGHGPVARLLKRRKEEKEEERLAMDEFVVFPE